MLTHPLDGLFVDGFAPRDDVDRLDVVVRGLRGMVMKHRPVEVRPLTLQEARAFVAYVHTHAPSLTGWKYGCAAWDEVSMVGMVSVGRPSARLLDDRRTLEITRCALMQNAPRNAASMLLGRACRVAKELGYPKIITYTLESEDGTSLRATGFRPVARSAGGEWGRRSREREEADFDTGPKVRWERTL
jgi:hypothetical protein